MGVFDWYNRCEICGRFVNPGGPGVSWRVTWSWSGGTPCLDDPSYRCSPCTDAHGVGPTNCADSYPGRGRNDLEHATGSMRPAASLTPGTNPNQTPAPLRSDEP